MATECTVADCARPHIAKGFCRSHYAAWRRHGDPLIKMRDRYATPEESFAARTRKSPSGCLEWIGTRYPNGYGEISVGGKKVLAHRYAWQRVHGEIPPSADIDHTCWNKACVNVEHLRPATRVQNNRNYSGAKSTNLSTGIRGVSISKRGHIRGRVHYEGREIGKMFQTVDEAADWVRAKRDELYGEFAGRG